MAKEKKKRGIFRKIRERFFGRKTVTQSEETGLESAVKAKPRKSAGRSGGYFPTVQSISKGQGGEGVNISETKTGRRKSVKLTYRAHEIIPRNSPFSHYFRTLLNAERFAAEGEIQ